MPTGTRRRAPIVTAYDLEGLRAAVDDLYTPPQRLTVAGFTKLGKSRREQWLHDRNVHHGRSVVVGTAPMGKAFTDIHAMCELNRYRPDDREVYLITGRAGLGKTTIARNVALNFERAYRHRRPDYRRDDECPVVMVATPAKCTPTAFDKAVLTFLHYSFPDRHTHERLKVTVVEALRNKRVQMVIIDDLHRLRCNAAGLETADLLKEYFDLTACSYIYLGINLTSSGFFDGDAGQQILNRGALQTLTPCSNERGQSREEWRAIVAGLENNLRLLRHTPGILTSDAMLQTLYSRTNGSLGALNKLLQRAAFHAATVEDPHTDKLRKYGVVGSERIDKSLVAATTPMAAIDLHSQPVRADDR